MQSKDFKCRLGQDKLFGVNPNLRASAIFRSSLISLRRLRILHIITLGSCFGSFIGQLCAANGPDVKSGATGVSASSDEALKILTKAQERMANFTTFQGTFVNTSEVDKTKAKTSVYQKSGSDGVLEMRMDSEYEVGKRTLKRTFLNNREGQWQLTPTTAVKMEYQEAMMAGVTEKLSARAPRTSMPGTYSLSETTVGNKSFWIVKFVMSDEMVKFAQGVVQGMNKPSPGKPSNKTIPFPNVYLYRIDKDDNIIYSTQQFDQQGNKVSDVTYQSVQFDLPLADDIFSIPKNLKRKVATTREEYLILINKTQ